MVNCSRVLAETFVKQIDHRAVLPSTNDLAHDLCQRQELPVPILVITDRQTAGRGRGDHRWWSGPGGLTFSLILDPAQFGLTRAIWPRMTLAAATAVGQVLTEFACECDWRSKWPNDVLLAGRKVCGILLEPAARPPAEEPPVRGEASTERSAIDLPVRLVLGIGLNVNNTFDNAPADVRKQATSVCGATARPQSCDDLLVALLQHLERRFVELATAVPYLPSLWMGRCALRGKQVAVDVGPEVVRGLCHGIDAEGALQVDADAGRLRLFGGTIVSSDG
jgi:BirA family biotin operon repressor/biotin-[acetyl-CoA-carboxylase] ligase